MDRYVLQILTAVLIGISGMCLAKDITVYSGQPGETLNIICPYQKQTDRWKKKVWCKEDDVGFCQLLVSVHPYWSNFKRTNMSIDISDNYHKGILTINITNLQKSDAGVYQCRTVKFGDVNTLQRIRVQILEDQMNVNISELDNAQHIISGSQTEKEIPLMLVVIGCSLISFKLLLLGSIVIWWKRNERRPTSKPDTSQKSKTDILTPGSTALTQSHALRESPLLFTAPSRMCFWTNC
ncbi:triggering receptor expressed on myeloid cells 2-like isoform X2 [Engystomops pustulosus]|uniref:triggering receptor expressed on myeloid cells 2-like isoform X2 n=1 Tax=Engystomops pustulosus TaxID=76066 RepID=UPI003AFB3129